MEAGAGALRGSRKRRRAAVPRPWTATTEASSAGATELARGGATFGAALASPPVLSKLVNITRPWIWVPPKSVNN